MTIGRINFGPAATPSFPDQIDGILRLADHIRDLDADRFELQIALDDQIALVQSLQDEIERLLTEKAK